MIRTVSDQRNETTENRFGGVGPVHMAHAMEKTDLLANCRLLARITLPPGSSIGYHQHDKEEEVYYILSGQGTVNDNGETRTVNPGDAVYTGNGAFHSIANETNEPLEFLGIVLTYEPPQR
ncbi:MAG: cupin domain-containing protein [Defluviitaleaceae bacterium]|nr:cupin domain-containing protein [Defluviitaleaceae bacterium]